MSRTSCLAVAMVVLSFPATSANPTVTALAVSSATYPAGYTSGGDLPPTLTANPLGPFSMQSVDFVGTLQPGASSETLPGAGGLILGLVYRYQLVFDVDVTISSVVVHGRAFNGPGNILRLLDKYGNVIASTPTVNSSNQPVATTLNTPGATGQVFFLDEFDTSENVRFRDGTTVNFASATPRLVLTVNMPSGRPSLPSMPQSVMITATVTDALGRLLDGYVVAVKVGTIDATVSGHAHPATGGTDPGSFFDTVTGTASNNCVTIAGVCTIGYKLSQVAGNFTIGAVAQNGNILTNTATQTITIQFGLGDLLGGTDFVLTGNMGTTHSCGPDLPILHPNNHSGTDDMVVNVSAVARDYNLQEHVRLGLNDMSLPWGGLFDICNDWKSPHAWHRTGISVDVEPCGYDSNGNRTTTAIDVLNVLDFIANQLDLFRWPERGSIHYELHEFPFF